MYPAPSNFREPAPMSVWFPVRMGTEQAVYATQYDALLRLFQSKAQTLLPVGYFFDRAQGRCPTDMTEALAISWSANWRRRDALTVDGQWGPETADALGYLLCATGQGEAARSLSVALNTPGTAIPADVLRLMFWLTQFVRAVGTAGEPGADASIEVASVGMDPNAVLPLQTTIVTSAPADRTFMTYWRPGVDQQPVAPSVAANTNTQPPTGSGAQDKEPRVTTLATMMYAAAAAAAGYFGAQWMKGRKK